MQTRPPVAAAVAVAVWTFFVFAGGWVIGALLTNRSAIPAAATINLTAGTPQVQQRGALFEEAWSRVRDNFVGQVPTDTLRDYGAIRGALSTLNDRYSYFIEPQTRTIERDHMRGQFGGIGVSFIVNDQGRVVLTPRKDGAAAKAGVLAGDVLIKIDGKPLPAPAKIDDVAPVRGEVGSSVRITVLRDGAERDFDIVRELIQVPSVEWLAVARGNTRYGLIQIRQFTERTGDEVKLALTELRAAGVAGYVLDMRDNTGGLLNAAVDVVSEFVDKGVVLIERKRDAQEVIYTVRDDSAEKAPLIVLINKNSASASEVVAGALQDYGRAKLVGERSFGKGSVQLIFDLSDGSSVHVTTAKWLTPNRNEIDGIGLTPDVVITRADGEAEGGKDSQLDRALAELGR
jgi:carboxyl-terminal processing protease